MSDINEILRQQKREQDERTTERVLAAARTLAEEESVTEYTLAHPLVVPVPYAGIDVEVTRLRVRRARYLQTEEVDTSWVYTTAGYAYDLKSNGQRDKRRQPSWRALPDEIAQALLGGAE